MDARPVLSLAEWAVLAVLSQRPTHGFAVAQLTAPGGELGRVWQIPKPIVYRSITRLLALGLLSPESTEPGLGPQRTIYAATSAGARAADEWLDMPVEHVRDIRSQLLLKLALLDRAGRDAGDLIRRQKDALQPIARALNAAAGGPGQSSTARSQGTGFDATLCAWRRATAAAALDFLDAITPTL
jgi:PadR family transcriptional regulator AphA